MSQAPGPSPSLFGKSESQLFRRLPMDFGRVTNSSAFLGLLGIPYKVTLPSRNKTGDPSVVDVVNYSSRKIMKPGSSKERMDAVCLKLISLGPFPDSFRCVLYPQSDAKCSYK